MAQQTAVEWLAKELESYGDPQVCEITWKDLDSLVEQAKQIDKERIMKAYNDGYRDGMLDHVDKTKDISEFDNARLYYNETYGK